MTIWQKSEGSLEIWPKSLKRSGICCPPDTIFEPKTPEKGLFGLASRTELIREACLRYLKQVEFEKMDEIYREGYEKIPGKPAVGKTQAAIIGKVLPGENW